MAETATTSWYRSGTVSITSGSDTVNGVSTNWSTAGIYPGSSFRIDGLADTHEVAEVLSDTKIKLARPYYGTTISGKSYSINRNFQSTVESRIAKSVTEMLGKYEEYIDTDMHTVQGESAYEIAKRLGKTTAATEAEWVEELQNGEEYVALKNTVAALTADEAGNHNAQYIEGAMTFTNEVSANIRNGSFKDLYPGKTFSFSNIPYEYYWPTSDATAVSGKTYYADASGTALAEQPETDADISQLGYFEKLSATQSSTWVWGDCDPMLRCGDSDLTAHHGRIFSLTPLFDAPMNKTNITAGGYPASYMRTVVMKRCEAILKACFGADHILNQRIYLPNAFNANGIATAGSWYTSACDLMSERMVYGASIFGPHYEWTSDSALFTTEKTQIAAFRHNPALITVRNQWCWLRDPVSPSDFAYVYHHGVASRNRASDSCGVRPAALIY